jgi:tetratricopeptide (TPR) repeat protein
LTDTERAATSPVVFVSYSKESEAHARWIENDFAARLLAHGCDVRLDLWEAAPGDPIPEFMERAVRESRHVLVVCTATYKQKMDTRTGGVGYEGHIMTGELFNSRLLPRKFIPVVRSGEPSESIPSWLLGRYYVDLRAELSDDQYERQFSTLLATLHGSLPNRPPLAPAPRPSGYHPSQAALAQSVEPVSAKSHDTATSTIGASSTTPRVSRQIPSPIFGRDSELDIMQGAIQALAATREGGGRAVIVSGPSGVGKTTLAETALSYAMSLGLRVIRATCESFHEGMSFYPIRECLRQVTSERGLTEDISLVFGTASSQLTIARLSEQPNADPSARRDALVATFANQIFACIHLDSVPVVLFIDDLERIDTGSVDAILCLLARLREGPVMLVGAYRSDVVPASGASQHPLRPMLSAVRRADTPARVIELGVLPETQLEGLVGTLLNGPCELPPSFLRRLFEETEGNPLYVREALWTLSDDRSGADEAPLRSIDGVWRLIRHADSWEIPRSIDDAIASRLVSISESDRAVLEVASIVGRRFRFEVLLDLGIGNEEQLIQILERQMDSELLRELGDADNTFEFKHGRIRDVLYNGMSGVRRARLHARVADVFLRRTDLIPSEQFDVVAGTHLFAARRYAAAAPHLLRAGQNALELHSPLEAAQHLTRALDALEKASGDAKDTVDRVRLALGLAFKARGEFVAAEAQFLLILRDGIDPYAQRWSWNHLGDVSLVQGRIHEALERFGHSETLARECNDNELLVETAADLAELHMRQAEQLAGTDAARANEHSASYEHYLELERALAGQSARRAVKARAYRNAAKRQRAIGNIEQAIALYEQSISFVDAGVDSHQFLIPYAKALRLVRRHEEALQIVRRVLDWSRQIGARRSEAIARQYYGLILMEKAIGKTPLDLAAAELELSRAIALHNEVGFEQGRRETEVDLAELAAHRGNRKDTAMHLNRALGDDEARSDEESAAAILAQLRANGEVDRADRFSNALQSLSLVPGSK